MSIRREIPIIGALFLTAFLVLAYAANAGELNVAFRADTPPFSSQSEDGFEGLLVDLCEEAIKRTDYSIGERHAITARNRMREKVSSFDVVCDPTTITLARSARFNFSQILFIANSSFLRRPEPQFLVSGDIENASAECRELHASNPDRKLVGVGMVGGTTANATFELAQRQRLVVDNLDYATCRFSFDTHDEGVAAVCKGHISFYFGDVDILREQSSRHSDCKAELHLGFLAYEPYAILVPSVDENFRRQFVSALYSIYADGTAFQYYQDNFGMRQMSEPLDMLFRINRIPMGQAQGLMTPGGKRASSN